MTSWNRLGRTLAALLLSALAAPAFAQADVRGAKDHPLLTRYPNSHITEYTKNYTSIEIAAAKAPDGGPQRQPAPLLKAA